MEGCSSQVWQRQISSYAFLPVNLKQGEAPPPPPPPPPAATLRASNLARRGRLFQRRGSGLRRGQAAVFAARFVGRPEREEEVLVGARRTGRRRLAAMSNHAAGTSNGGSADGDGAAARRNTKMPKYSKFTQQELPACKPILTPKWVVSVFFLVGIIFVPVGVVSLLAARDVVEIIDRYDDACVPDNMTDNKLAYIQNPNISKNCTRTLTVTEDMNQPIFVYYQLDNFYQNHRRYVKSRNDGQLRDAAKANQTSSCEPEKTTADGKPIVPCGLIAWSLFNDTYSFTRGNESLPVDKKDISWKSDREHKFGKNVYPSNFQNGALKGGGMLDPSAPLSEQEDLIVWMRTAALPTFRKLYGRIYIDLKKNDTITVRLSNNYNTYNFGGKKKLVLSTATWLGGKNDFLGFAYVIVGGLCFFLAFAFTLLYFIKPRLVTNELMSP
ncbi:hypothetical protein GUJ93_ZPchr0006g45843 [Zizania palustris]|uniref:ALA-interacting subunit n=1 Tax=Zizania palustris TaxID=103762 RepID=A0A8J5VKL6_ZIZPA|nr:hypothetical protein GUJ93_ZPchr0006g45843 [Zizania palustris]